MPRLSFPARRALPLLLSLLCAGTASAQMRITEFKYNADLDANAGEFMEFSNVGALPIDMTGWSYDDSGRTPGYVPLSNYGVVLPGESVILAQPSAEAFRTAWGLCAGVKVIGGLSRNLGRADEINLYDADGSLVDRLTYADNGAAGGPRTNQHSAWVTPEGLGQNTATAWALSTTGSFENSFQSQGGAWGSPGRSAHATVAYDPCAGTPEGFPQIEVAATTTPRLRFDAPGYGFVAAALDDPSDAARFAGIDFTFSDTETDAAELIVSVSSSNQAVVADAGLELSGSGATRSLRIAPLAAGRTIVTLSVTDGDAHTSRYYLLYAAAPASTRPALTRFHTGACDASTAAAIDADYFFMANDEDQRIRLYSRTQSGFFGGAFDFTADLGLSDLSGGVPREVDIEAVERIGNRLFWLGSHSNAASGALRVNRYRLFATDVSGSGAESTLDYVGRYDHLRADLLAWDANDGHGLGAGYLGFASSAQDGVIPEEEDGSGFNIEGLVMAPDGTTAYVGFRAPLIDMQTRDRALIVPVQDFAGLIGSTGPASFGAPILLNLDGRAIRALERSADGRYLIIGGPTASDGGFALYVWDGNPATVPHRLATDLSFDVAGGSFEGVMGPLTSLDPGSEIQLVIDNGDTSWFGDGICKESGTREQQMFRSERVTLSYASGVDDGVQNGVPDPVGSGSGDGNGDGTPDAQQPNVVSLPVNGSGGPYATLAAEADDNGGQVLPIVAVEAVPVPDDAPGNLQFPFGAFRFTVLNVVPGSTVNLALYLPAEPVVGGFYKRNVQGEWMDIASAITTVGSKQRIAFSIQDGGPFDADGLVNGQIVDPGAPVLLPTSGDGITAVPVLPLPLAAALAGLLAFGAGRGLRRR